MESSGQPFDGKLLHVVSHFLLYVVKLPHVVNVTDKELDLLPHSGNLSLVQNFRIN